MIDLSIRRPVLTTMVMAALAVLGLVALLKTPRTLIPSLRMPYVTVTVVYPGAGPEEIESRITKPVEDAVSGIEGLKHIYSISMSNVAIVTCEFEVGTDPDRAASDVREKVSSVRGKFPEGVKEPVVQKIDIRASPVMLLALHGGLSQRELRELADDVIKPRLARVPGVGSVDVFGGLEREIEVEVDKDRLWAYGLSLNQFISLLRAQSLKVPAGEVRAGPREYGVRTLGEFTSVEEIRDAEIPLPAGGMVKVSDLARVYDGAKEPDYIGRYNGRRAIIIQVVKRPEASAVGVADGLRKELRRLRRLLPRGVRLDVAIDMSEHERDAFRVNLSTLIGGILLAALVLLLFLGSLRVTLIASTVMPAAAIAALFPIFMSGFTLNILSLGGIALTIGTLAALSIVILESVETQRLGGLPPQEAASVGTKRVAVPTVASALTNIVIFLPIAFAGGLVGMFLRELGLSVTYATLMALLFCFTLMPMMAAHIPVFGRAKAGKAKEPLASRLMRRWADGAAKAASWCLRHRALTILMALLVFLPAIPVKRKFVGTEFMPRTDIGKFCITVEAPEGASLQETERVVGRIERAVMRHPEVESVVSVVGRVTELMGVRMAHNLAMITVSLKPLKERRKSQREVMRDVEPEVTRVAGARKVRIFEYSQMGGINVPLEVDVLSPDLALAASASKKVYEIAERLPGAKFVDTTWKPGPPELRLIPDRERCADAGVTVAQVAMLLRSAVEGDTTMKFRRHGKEYDVRIRLEKEDRDSVEDLADVPVSPLAGGGMAMASSLSSGPGMGMMAGGFTPPLLRLGDLCRVEFGRAPTSIDKKDRLYMVGVSGDSEVPLGDLVARIRKAVKRLRLPKGVEVGVGRMTEMMEEAFGTLVMSFAIAIALTFITLAAVVESYSMPLSMMLTVPLAYAGGIYLLALTRMPFAITSMMAMIMLVGLVVNNAVLVLDAMAQRRKEGIPRERAAAEAVRERFRPVIMATLAIIAGMLPTALAKSGVGAMRAPMAVTIIGGMILSTVLVFFVIPAVQAVLEDLASLLLSAFGVLGRAKGPKPT